MNDISTYLYWLAEKTFHGVPVKAEKDLVYSSIRYLSLVWPDVWPSKADLADREHKVMRLLLAAELAREAGE